MSVTIRNVLIAAFLASLAGGIAWWLLLQRHHGFTSTTTGDPIHDVNLDSRTFDAITIASQLEAKGLQWSVACRSSISGTGRR